MGLEETVVSLKTLGVEYAVLESGADGAVLVLPEYGRVLGVWPHWRGDNALWVNPGFLRLLHIGSKDDGWINPGGDRMWLAPEEEFLAEGPEVPPAIDPGQFARSSEKSGYAMENKGEALAWKTGSRIRFRLIRRVRQMNEARLADLWGTTWLRQAGYEEETVLEISGDCRAPVWLWNITQARMGAEIRVPLRKRWTETSLVTLPARSLEFAEDCAVVRLRGPQSEKVEIPGADAGNRILCLEERESGRAQLLVKDFAREEGRDDARVDCRTGGMPDTIEFSCCSPALGSTGKRRVVWKTSLCAFSGRSDEIQAFAARIGSRGSY
jgi:hypothetical protein